MDTYSKSRFITNIAYYSILVAIVVLFCKFLLPSLWPFIIAFAIASICNKPMRKIMEKVKLKPVAMAITMILFYGIAFGFFGLIVVQLIRLLGALFDYLPKLYTSNIAPALYQAGDIIEGFFVKYNIPTTFDFDDISRELISSLGEFISKYSGSIISWTSSGISSIPSIFIKTVLTIVSSFYILSDYDHIMESIKKLIPEKYNVLLADVKEFMLGTVWKCGKSYLLILCMTCLELTIGLTLFRIKNSFLVALAISICDIFPILGVGTVLGPWGFICLIIGKVGLGLELFALYIVITVIRNIVEPRIVGAQIDLTPIVALISVFVGTQVLGAAGLLLGPIMIGLLKYLVKKGHISFND